MKAQTLKKAAGTLPGKAMVLLAAALLGVGLLASPASADGTWTYSFTPNPAAPGEDVTISGTIEGCDFVTPAGGEVLVIVYDPDNVEYGPFVVVPENTATNTFSYTFTIPAGGPAGEWLFIVAYTGLVPTGCAAPGAEQNVEVVADADSPALAVVPAVGVVGLGGLYLATRKRRSTVGSAA
jgi:hypothetical protein